MRLLLTHGSGPSAPLLELVSPHLAAYAAAHGYEFAAHRSNPALGGRPPQWAKFALLREALEHYEGCLWVDSDIVLRAGERDITADVHPADFQALCMEQTPHGPGPNTGIWWLSNRPEAHAFLRAVWERGPVPGATLNDQAAVARELGFSWLPRLTRPLHASQWLARTGWLDPRWNTLAVYYPESIPVARGVHYGGMLTADKLHAIRHQLVADRLLGWEQALPASTVAAIREPGWEHPAPCAD